VNFIPRIRFSDLERFELPTSTNKTLPGVAHDESSET
jgi:hypothetical protein